jgi:hypothetical protein
MTDKYTRAKTYLARGFSHVAPETVGVCVSEAETERVKWRGRDWGKAKDEGKGGSKERER